GEAEVESGGGRVDGGIRTKAARGELRIGLPIGLVWGEADGQILKHPDEAVRGVLTAIFEQFPAHGSVRSVWLWLRDQGLQLPLSKNGYVAATAEIVWVDPTYHAVHNILTHPAYAGAYIFRPDRSTPLRRLRRRTAGAAKGVAPQRVGGLHHRPPRGIHRLGHLPGQPGPDRPPHPPGRASTRYRRGAGGLRPAARAGHLRDLRTQTRHLLRRRTQSHARLLLHRHRPTRRRPRHRAPAGRRCGDRRRGHRPVPDRAGPRLGASLPAGGPTTRRRPRRRPATMAPPGGTRPPRRRQGRTALPGGRPGEPARRPRTGERVGNRAAAPRRRRNRTRAPRSGTPENPDTTGESGDPGPRRQPRNGVGRAHHHRPRPQTTPA